MLAGFFILEIPALIGCGRAGRMFLQFVLYVRKTVPFIENSLSRENVTF
jgi:hypothetical protein